jgi:hypothetical protein
MSLDSSRRCSAAGRKSSSKNGAAAFQNKVRGNHPGGPDADRVSGEEIPGGRGSFGRVDGGAHQFKKSFWGTLTGVWFPHEVRDQIADFVRRWWEKTDIGAARSVDWLGITAGKFYGWRERYGKANEHNGRVPRESWLEAWERQEIVGFHLKNPLEGYRRLTFMMPDADIVAVSPSSLWRVGLLMKSPETTTPFACTAPSGTSSRPICRPTAWKRFTPREQSNRNKGVGDENELPRDRPRKSYNDFAT